VDAAVALDTGVVCDREKTAATWTMHRLVSMIHIPVPVKDTDCGEVVALSAIVTDPVRAPILVGVNATWIVHHWPAANLSVPTQSLV
jgi:hypothetical protein